MIRAVARSENLGGHVVLGGDNVPPPGQKLGGPAPPLATGLDRQNNPSHCTYSKLKFMFSKKATKIDEIFTIDLTL